MMQQIVLQWMCGLPKPYSGVWVGGEGYHLLGWCGWMGSIVQRCMIIGVY